MIPPYDAKCRDISAEGMRLECREDIPLEFVILQFSINTQLFTGLFQVRRRKETENGYELGMEALGKIDQWAHNRDLYMPDTQYIILKCLKR